MTLTLKFVVVVVVWHWSQGLSHAEAQAALQLCCCICGSLTPNNPLLLSSLISTRFTSVSTVPSIVLVVISLPEGEIIGKLK